MDRERVVFVRCELSRSAFPNEAVFQIGSQSADGVSGVAQLHYCYSHELTPLRELSDGEFAALLTGGVADNVADLRVTLSDNTTFTLTVNLATNSDVEDLLEELAPSDAITKSKFVVSRSGDHFVATDSSKGQGQFKIEAINGSFVGLAGMGLGIIGQAPDPDANGIFKIEGAALHGDTLANHLFLERTAASTPTFQGHVTLTANDIDGTANFGLVKVDIVNGSGSANFDINIQLADPNTAQGTVGRITLPELFDGITSTAAKLGTTTLAGSASLNLPVSLKLFPHTELNAANMPELKYCIDLVGAPIVVSWPEVFAKNPVNPGSYILNLDSLDVSLSSEASGLQQFVSFSAGALVGSLGAVEAVFAATKEDSLLAAALPILPFDLNALLGFNQIIHGVIEEFQKDGDELLNSVEERLETAVERAVGREVSPMDTDVVTLSCADGVSGFRIDIDLQGFDLTSRLSSIDRDKDKDGVQVPLDFKLPGMTELFGQLTAAGGGGMLTIVPTANFHVALGIDLNDPRRQSARTDF